MTNLLVSYPSIDTSDFDFIQKIREYHDHRYAFIIDPHVTLVFGTNKLGEQELFKFAKRKLKNLSRMPFSFDHSIVVKDKSNGLFHTFLIPSIGYRDINKFHDLLYEDELEAELRTDIPFVPHITIGANESMHAMNQLAASFNDSSINIRGHLDAVTLVRFDGAKFDNLYMIRLC